MLRTHIPDRFASSDIADTTRPQAKPVTGQTEPFMFTRLFFVTGVLLGALALAAMLSS
ncbi:hypothetical protein ACFFTN_22935 [Aminobacter aganoensis]|uniref:Uncharacterized protein n=1 Tax=Aminobacter aganoensis TaxID=83264 RepID=A0A7X0KMF1_9HYPH|nr:MULTISPECIES: hypothetical protein [Aminobacter]MBB6356070.1 hypothetical protein [Aminobacter aganoensis]